MKVRGQRTGRCGGGVGVEWTGRDGGEESGRREGVLSVLRDRDLELHSRTPASRH